VKIDNFEAMRRLATTLGVSAPESNDDIFSVSFINSMTRAAKRATGGEKKDKKYMIKSS